MLILDDNCTSLFTRCKIKSYWFRIELKINCDSLQMITSEWWQVTVNTVQNCWIKGGFIPRLKKINEERFEVDPEDLLRDIAL